VSRLTWYAARLRTMTATEIAGRTGDAVRQARWHHQRVLPEQWSPLPPTLRERRPGPVPLPAGTLELVDPAAASAVVAAADRILAGRWEILGVERRDLLDPDWFLDPVSGRRAPQTRHAFATDHRDAALTGNVKQVWELSRHHHLTVLASAWWLTGDDAYADVVAAQLRSWWAESPYLCGIHWTSGIELGVRLISWAWIRRLLDRWPGVEELFAEPDALRQLWWHQRHLAAFPSRGTSANNHAVAEAAGRLVAACAFDWYDESPAWRREAADDLARHLEANTFASGLNREQASDYHRFVTELGLVAAVEADLAGVELPPATWELLASSVEAAAAVADVTGRGPRQGDGDDGRALLLDDPAAGAWRQLLSVGTALTGPPRTPAVTTPTVAAVVLGALDGRHRRPGVPAPRRTRRAQVFEDAGCTVLRADGPDGTEIWCRCDGGPHGLPGIWAHAHADALSVEVRYDGIDVLADPGTYCYHDEAPWRSYFRSTLGHNTLEIDGHDQSVPAGPFLWRRPAEAEVDAVRIAEDRQIWVSHHTGYHGARHDRIVSLTPSMRHLAVIDNITGDGPGRPLRLAFHLGPAVSARLDGHTAHLGWVDGRGTMQAATLALPRELSWSAHRGETDPILGWYSPSFGVRVPATTLVGAGIVHNRLELCTALRFHTPPAPECTATADAHVAGRSTPIGG
jgi:hypothetical protein